MEVELLRSVFESYRTFYAKLGSMGLSMPLDSTLKADRIFIEWLMSTTHDAYFTHTTGGVRYVEPFDSNKYRKLVHITFFPKGATAEEISNVLNAKWKA